MRTHHPGRAVLSSLALSCVLLAGCLSNNRQAFVPATPTPVYHAGMPGARYELPGGRVILATVPLSEMPKGHHEELVGVRLFLKNDTDSSPWLVDVHEQMAQFAGQSQPVQAVLVKNRQRSDIVAVPRGRRETIDIFYAVPAETEGAGPPKPSDLSVTWRIQVGPEPFVHQTSMFRARLAPVPGLKADYGQTMGELWFNPAWNLPTPFYPPLTVEWHVVGPVAQP